MSEYIISQEEYRGHRITIRPDEDPISPREDPENCLGIMVTKTRNHNFGEVTNLSADEMTKLERHNGISLPVYLYEHSCTLLSTRSWVGRAHHADWDSGRIGFIYTTPERIRAFYGKKYVTKELIAKALEVLAGEVDSYSHYVNGDVYGYTIDELEPVELDEEEGFEEELADREGEEVDSSYGWYDTDEALKSAKAEVDAIIERKAKASREETEAQAALFLNEDFYIPTV